MPHPVEPLFKINNKDVVDVLLVLAVFFTQNSDVEDLFLSAFHLEITIPVGWALNTKN